MTSSRRTEEIRISHLVVDGSNLAHAQRPIVSLSPVVRARKRLAAEYPGASLVVLCDATLRHRIKERARLEQLLESGKVHEVPAGTEADEFILKYAHRVSGAVVSRDRYIDYERERRGIPLIKPMWIDGEIILSDPIVFTGSAARPRKVSLTIAAGEAPEEPAASAHVSGTRDGAAFVRIRGTNQFARTYYESVTLDRTELRGSAPLPVLRALGEFSIRVEFGREVTLRHRDLASLHVGTLHVPPGTTHKLRPGTHTLDVGGVKFELTVQR